MIILYISMKIYNRIQNMIAIQNNKYNNVSYLVKKILLCLFKKQFQQKNPTFNQKKEIKITKVYQSVEKS